MHRAAKQAEPAGKRQVKRSKPQQHRSHLPSPAGTGEHGQGEAAPTRGTGCLVKVLVLHFFISQVFYTYNLKIRTHLLEQEGWKK